MAEAARKAGAIADRRSYPIVIGVEYKLAVDGRPMKTGRGWTASLSSAVITFDTTERLPPGTRIDLSIAWPALLDNRVGLRLCIKGSILESQSNRVTVEILRYEFRTRYLKSEAVRSTLVKLPV